MRPHGGSAVAFLCWRMSFIGEPDPTLGSSPRAGLRRDMRYGWYPPSIQDWNKAIFSADHGPSPPLAGGGGITGPPWAFSLRIMPSALLFTSSYFDRSQNHPMWSISSCVKSGLMSAANPTGGPSGAQFICPSRISQLTFSWITRKSHKIKSCSKNESGAATAWRSVCDRAGLLFALAVALTEPLAASCGPNALSPEVVRALACQRPNRGDFGHQTAN